MIGGISFVLLGSKLVSSLGINIMHLSYFISQLFSKYIRSWKLANVLDYSRV